LICREYLNIQCIGIYIISISSFQHRSEGIEAHIVAFNIKKGLDEPLLLIEDMNLTTLSSCKLKPAIILPCSKLIVIPVPY
jgi:hypothetical protein